MSENNDTETPLSPRTVHYEKGKRYFKDRNYRKSIRSFTAAIEASPSDAKLYLDRGLAYIELDKYNDAIADFTKAIEFAPNYAAAFNNRGFACAKLDKHDLAMKDYTKAIQLDPAHMDAYRNRADLFDVLERYIEAISDYTKALELKPTSAITWNDRGETFDRIQHYYDAVKDYTKAIELKPNFAIAYFNRGETYRHLGRLEDAIKDFQQSIALDQDDPDSYRYMGTCLHQLGKIDEAVKYFTAAIDMGDSSASILVSRALAYLDAKKYDSASADVDLALKVKNCNMAHAYYGKAIVLMQSGEETQALKELERAIEIDYTFIPALFYKSLVLMSLKRYKEGIDVLKDITYSYLQPRRHDTTREIIDSLTSDEFQWSAHLFLSFGYRSINLLQESSQEINEMWKVTHQFVNTNEKRNELFFGPNMAELKSYYEACRYMLTARSLFDQGEFKSALKEIDKSIELDGKNPESYALKAMVFNAMGHYKLAVGLCDRALKIEPRSATAVCHKAHATLGLGDPKTAAREIQRSIELDPHLGFSYYVKGLVNIDDKHFKEAVQDYNMFLNCLDAYHFPHLMEIAKSCIHEISHTIPFEKIQLKEEIGKGDYGQVYKAVYNNEIVAAKKYNESTKASAQILHEVATMKLIPPHPNLVKMIGLCVEPLISIMDLCNQGNLQKFLSSAKPIEERVKSKLIMDIAKGMLHLHSQNRPVLHRNLNSTNVLLKETDSQLSAVISDFGITKSKSTDKAEDSFKWMAPEVMLEKQYSFMSDVFSFGVIVWEIITQKAPWEGYGEAKMLVAIENGEQLSLPFDISDFMKDLVLNCWEKNPENRWSFGKIVEHLEKNKEVRLFRIFSVHRKQTE